MIDLDTVSQTTLIKHNQAIAQWTRHSGTPEERAAAAYAEEQLRASGYTTEILRHDAYISLPGAATLQVTSPHQKQIPCITHSMLTPTGHGGASGELVDVGTGSLEEYALAAATGKIALVEGIASEDHAVNATRAGVRAVICISGRYPHEMCCSPVWGNPSQSTLAQLPRVHMLSVTKEDGEALRDLCKRGRVDVHLTAAVETKWTTTPIVLANLTPGHHEAEPDKFVLFSGHLDSWHVGAMDNGSANAAMLEVARVLSQHRMRWRWGLRIAMWSGHSHGRYSSSAWYADNHWFDLADHCLVHVNIDSVGGIGADTFKTISMPETLGLAQWAVQEVTGASLAGRRVGRSSDQSFLGIGVPSILASVSRQADESLGWWWHTQHDTVDKIDPVRLSRDTKIFLRVLERLLTDPVLPLDYAASAADLRANLEELASAAGAAFDLSFAIAAASTLEARCIQLNRLAAHATPAQAGTVNACLRSLGRILIPAMYTSSGNFGHDPALESGFLPRLKDARRLAHLTCDSDEAKLLLVDLVRGRNSVAKALTEACSCVESCLRAAGLGNA